MRSEDISKTAFITSNGFFAFKRMSFVLLGGLSSFLKAMNTTLIPLIV